MEERASWKSRQLRKLSNWLDARAGPPHSADLLKYERNWDYDQANRQPRDAEPDRDRLTAALTLVPTEPARAFAELLALSDAGSLVATNAVGERYYWGIVAPKDREEGERWFKRAFELGSRRGLLNYGLALFRRHAYAEAAAVFGQGAADDWAPALYWLARLQVPQLGLLKGVRRARPMLERAAELGSPAAKGRLAALMSAGFLGLKRISEGIRMMNEYMAEMTAAIVGPKKTRNVLFFTEREPQPPASAASAGE